MIIPSDQLQIGGIYSVTTGMIKENPTYVIQVTENKQSIRGDYSVYSPGNDSKYHLNSFSTGGGFVDTYTYEEATPEQIDQFRELAKNSGNTLLSIPNKKEDYPIFN